MRILLLGEYSRLHNSLKEGLLLKDHEVVLVGNGDGFKNYPSDISLRAVWCETKLGKLVQQSIHRLFKFDIALLEHAIRFYKVLPQLKGFDVVQLINEKPIQTVPFLECWFLKKIVAQNQKLFVLASGVDYLSVQFLMDKKIPKSIMQPYFDNPKLKKEYNYILEYTSKGNAQIHEYVYQNCVGYIASDIDYVLPLKGNPKFLGLIPNPVNCEHLAYQELDLDSKIVLFLGINQWNYHQKGIAYFEKALAQIQARYGERVEVVIAQNIPYDQYITLYNQAHIVLDQVYAYDQGYNALEAMAKGKVVFTGAEKEFEAHYKLAHRVAINAKPDVDYLVQQLSDLIDNPQQIKMISQQAREFILRAHHYKHIADTYLTTWEQH